MSDTEEQERPALVLEYNADNKCVDLYWAETEDSEPSYITSHPVRKEPSVEELSTLGNNLLEAIRVYASELLEAIGEESDEDIEDEPEPPKHNHMTRDLKPPGLCPGCDPYWERHG